MLYNTNYWGMGLIWWIVWIMLILWIFAVPYRIPFQRYRIDSPLDILQRRFATGAITKEEYHEKKKIIENDLPKVS